jgi:hypothetical protein
VTNVLAFAYRPRGPGGRHWCFDESGVALTHPDTDIPTVSNGFPVSEVCRTIMDSYLAHDASQPANVPRLERFRSFFGSGRVQDLLGGISGEPDDRLP